MLTGKLLSTKDNGITWFDAPKRVELNGRKIGSRDMANRGEWEELISADPPTYREWREPGQAWTGYDDPVIQSNPEPGDDIAVAAVYFSGTQEEQAAAQRQRLASDIEANRLLADLPTIDLRRDPGLSGLQDEANAAADERLKVLNATVDADLPSFDPSLNPDEVGAVAMAASLARQETALLNSGLPLTQAQRGQLETYIAAHQAIVDAGDNTAEVHEVPSFARRHVGIVGEDYGIVIATRVQDGEFWKLEFELRTERQLSPGDYWMAVYDDTAPDGKDDTTTGYLTTPQLTEVGSGVYKADKDAVGLAENNPDKVYKFTLCYQHISKPQFDKMTLVAGDPIERYRARWAGNATEGGPWVDTGQTVDSIPYGNGLRIQDTTGFSAGDQIRMNDLVYQISSVFNATDLILTAHPDNSVIGHPVYKR